MATRLTIPVAIEDLPYALRSEALDKLIADESTRKVSAFIKKHGYQVSHNTLARYKRDKINPAVATSQKVLEIQRVAETNVLGTDDVASVTKHLIEADPFITRINQKHERLDRVFTKAEENGDFKAVAQIDRADTAVMTLHAQLTGRLVDRGPTMNVQMVFAGNPVETAPKQEPLDNGDVIDIRAVTR